MSSITSPLAGTAGPAARIVGMSMTNPTAAGVPAGFPAAPAAATSEALPALQVGIATQYWDECVAYPPGSPASLWLFVDNAWRAHDDPSAATRDLVQRAFLGADSSVRVWYDGTAIVGIVVSGS